MTADVQAMDPEVAVQKDPGVLEVFLASFMAVVKKESRWRMRGRRAFVIVTVYLALLALLVLFVYQTLYDRAVLEEASLAIQHRSHRRRRALETRSASTDQPKVVQQ